MGVPASGSYQQSGPSAPQTARAVLAELPGQVKSIGLIPAFLVASGIRFQARASGVGGEAITVALVAAGNGTALSVSVTSNAITVNLATDGAGNSVSTARQVADILNVTPTSSALIAAAVTSGDGTAVVAPLAATALAGDTALQNTGVVDNSTPLPAQHPIHNSYR